MTSPGGAADRAEFETLLVEPAADGVVVITLNRPERGNSVVPELARDLLAALTDLEADRSVRCLILTGAGRVFSAGADLKAMRQYLDERLAVEQEPYNARVLFPVTQRIVASRLPVVAAINGAATAGGLDLALACDLRICAASARLGETYINLGLPPGNGGIWFLPRLLGPRAGDWPGQPGRRAGGADGRRGGAGQQDREQGVARGRGHQAGAAGELADRPGG